MAISVDNEVGESGELYIRQVTSVGVSRGLGPIQKRELSEDNSMLIPAYTGATLRVPHLTSFSN
jgi:hypothetical protein